MTWIETDMTAYVLGINNMMESPVMDLAIVI
jgi:hypothetical protein